MSTLREQLQEALGNAYSIERELGGGGMSQVFLAGEARLNRQVVIKVLPPELAAGLSAERFEREIGLAAALQQANIVPVLAAGDVDGLPYYTMPFVEGLSLRARLDRGPMPLGEVVSVLRDVARALKYAHEKGVVHRDIKPENVLLSGDAAVVTDFGIAKALAASREKAPGGTLTQIGTSLGTPTYMAPEQAAGDPETDHRADIYAMGVMAYEMLAGAPPFHSRPPHQLFAAHMTETPVPLAAKRQDVPAPLAALVMRALAKNPGDRPQTAGDLLRALDDPELLSGQWKSRAYPRAPGRGATIAVGALLLMLGIAALWRFRGGGDRSGAQQSIAVLPMTNLGGDSADAYFADGMAEELTGSLSKVPGLRVASRTAAFAFRGRTATPTEIGQALNVRTLLEGSVRRSGNRLRLSARLTNAADGLTVWSETYERETSDVFEVQDELANAIVAALRVQLTPGERVGGERGTNDLEAYDLYLRGRYFFQKRGRDQLNQALVLYRRAVARDSNFARAWAGIGDVYGVLPLWSNAGIDTTAPRALAAIDRAIGLDSMLAEAHASRGTVLQLLHRWDEAIASLRRAVQLDPGYATGHQWLGEALILTGEVEGAVASLRRSVELDPVSPVMWASYGFCLAVAGRDADAMSAIRRSRELDSAFVLGPYFAAWIHTSGGRKAEALAEMRSIESMADVFPVIYGFLGYTMAASGDVIGARILAEKLEQSAARRKGYASTVGMTWLGLGDVTRATEWLIRSARERESFFGSTSLSAAPFDLLRTEPRFTELLTILNLPPRMATDPRPGYRRP